jgi:hypothetical protein
MTCQTFDTRADAADGDRFLATEGHVNMRHGIALVVGEDCSHTGNFVRLVKNPFDEDQRVGATFFRPGDQPAARIGIAEGDQSGRRDILFTGEALKTFVDDIAVLQADDENAAEGCL